MLTLNDIPIVFINLALLAIIALPVVILLAAHYVARQVVRPLWAMRHLLEMTEHDFAALKPKPEPRVAHEPTPHRGILHSMFGR